MGKWAQYSKRGTARHVGILAAPIAGEFTVDNITQTSARYNRISAQPGGSSGWGAQTRLQAGGGILATSAQLTGPNSTQSGLAAATPLQVRFAWFVNGVPGSDWGPWVNYTTLP